MKTKIGTILENEVVQKLKERALQEGRPINEVIQDALKHYLLSGSRRLAVRQAALAHFCSHPFNISTQDWREIMEEDYYEQ